MLIIKRERKLYYVIGKVIEANLFFFGILREIKLLIIDKLHSICKK